MNFALTEFGASPSLRPFSADDIRRMLDAGILREDERLELIEGNIVALGHSRIAHELIKCVLGMTMVRLASKTTVVGIATTLQFADDVLVDPDIAIFSRRVFDNPGVNYFVRPDPQDIGLMIEIGAETLEYDRLTKARLYARFGLPEYWVIDAYERTTRVHKAPSGETWSSIIERGPNDALTTPALPGFSFRLGDIQ
jgi:Uma2 family endonuclease